MQERLPGVVPAFMRSPADRMYFTVATAPEVDTVMEALLGEVPTVLKAST